MAKRKKIVPPTDAEIKAEIKALRELQPHVRRTNAFGDDNQEAIGAQIYVLEQRMDNDELYDRYEPRDDNREDTSEHKLEHALDAHRWMTGEGDGEKPSDGWRTLDQRHRR